MGFRCEKNSSYLVQGVYVCWCVVRHRVAYSRRLCISIKELQINIKLDQILKSFYMEIMANSTYPFENMQTNSQKWDTAMISGMKYNTI